MGAVSFDIDYTEPRSRLTNGLRLIWAIPHLLITGLLSRVAQLIAVIQWFIVLFTGRRNAGLWGFTNGIVNWQARATAYAGLMYDAYPNFGFEPGAEPVRYSLDDVEPANRLTNGLRLIWAIPAILLSIVLGIAGFVVTVVCWFAILFTGSQPRGMFDFLLKVHRYGTRTTAYVLLLTDTYPAYE
jgi:hypothetical protein